MGKRRETDRHREAFALWHDSDRDFGKVSKAFSVSEVTIFKWARFFDWRPRADAIDRAAVEKADSLAVSRKAKMLERHREAGALLVARGTEALRKKKIKTPKDAVSAIRTGVDVERKAEGLDVPGAGPTVAVKIDLAEISVLLRGGASAPAPPAPDVLEAETAGEKDHAP